jgi:pyridoxal/pyridoxine/pyridoxamine kinase
VHYFDSSREALVAGLKAAPWLVKPNRRELEIWAGRKLPEMKDVIDAAHALREQGIAHVVISSAKRARCGLTLWRMDCQTAFSRSGQHRWRRGFHGWRPDLRPADA